MAHAAVDEAMRNVVAVGADPDRVALLDNFSWGDPRRPSTLGELVAAVDGCCAGARMYNAPFVSGKDSLNNEYVGADGQRHAVPPTLVITAVAHVPDADHCVTPDLAEPGNARAIAARGHDERLRQAIIDVLALDLTIDVLHDPEPAAPGPGRGGDQSGASGPGRGSVSATQVAAGSAPEGGTTQPSGSPGSSRSGRPADVVRAAGSASPQDEGVDEPSPDDPDVESDGAIGLALINRELGARPIREIHHS